MKKISFKLFALAALVCCMSASAAKPKFPLLPTAPYDTIIDGQKVALYTIKKGKVAAQIINYGGFVVGLYAPDKNGEYANLVTHYDDIHQYMRYNMGMVGPALGRYANRIANGKFTLDGKEYNITKNSGQHTLHGGAKGFDHTAWKVVKAKKNKLVLSCVLPDGLDGFPGTLTTTLTYSITKDGGLQISYEATTDKATVVNLSNHTYFNLDGVGNGDIMDHELYINAAFITETDRSNIPTGDLGMVEGSPYDFQKPVRIGDRQYSPAPPQPGQGGGRGGFGARVAVADSAVLADRFPRAWFATMTTTSASFMSSRVRLRRLPLSTLPSQADSWRFGTTIPDFRSIPVHAPLSLLSHRCIRIHLTTTSSPAQPYARERSMSTPSSTSSL